MYSKIVIFSVFTLLALTAVCQNADSTIHERYLNENVEELSLFVGYDFNPNVTGDKKSLHFFELGIKRNFDVVHFEAFCKSIYFSNEFLISNKDFFIGPKMGAYVSVMAMTLGSELIYYTNFSGESIRFSPYFGFGCNAFRLTLQFPINLYKDNFNYINPVTFHLSVQFVNLWKKTLEQSINDTDK